MIHANNHVGVLYRLRYTITWALLHKCVYDQLCYKCANLMAHKVLCWSVGFWATEEIYCTIDKNRYLVHERKRGICNGNNMMGTRDESMIGVASVKDITTNKQVLSLSLSLDVRKLMAMHDMSIWSRLHWMLDNTHKSHYGYNKITSQLLNCALCPTNRWK